MLLGSAQTITDLAVPIDRERDHLRGPANSDVTLVEYLSSVAGTPTFFVNGRRRDGAYDIRSLSQAVRAVRARATLAA